MACRGAAAVGVTPPGRPRQRGFTLAECLVALTLAGFALVAATVAVSSQARAAERLQVQQELLQAVEATVEGIRGGAVPLASTPQVELASADGVDGVGVHSAVEVEPLTPAGLYRVAVTSRTSLRGETMELSVATMVWRP